jgi:hypothetical protein
MRSLKTELVPVLLLLVISAASGVFISARPFNDQPRTPARLATPTTRSVVTTSGVLLGAFFDGLKPNPRFSVRTVLAHRRDTVPCTANEAKAVALMARPRSYHSSRAGLQRFGLADGEFVVSEHGRSLQWWAVHYKLVIQRQRILWRILLLQLLPRREYLRCWLSVVL